MKKFRWYYDRDKEELWLNGMAAKGWALTGFCMGLYTFERSEAGKYTYRIDLMDNVEGAKDSREYIDFVESTGAEFVCSWFRWVYFRKDTARGAFELYSDPESRLRNYQKIRVMFLIIFFANLFFLTQQLSLLVQYPNIFTTVFVVLFICLLAVLGTVLYQTTGKIRKLKKDVFQDGL